ncbi:MAG: phosphoribosylformylglycinamidine cyclo-ligase [Caldithrix sp.]|nr:MAG: phosphoribosylformylglycinamidine cyclo-ligase [Caldithrix sp.]
MTQVTYENAGVSREVSENAKDSIKAFARTTHSKNVLKETGLFSGFYALDFKKFKRPVLASSIDGVGTKVKIAQMMGVYDSIGRDLVNHCVNDIMVCGAEPLFFLDYLAADKLHVNVIEEIVKGISVACKDAGCALIGGETAEMPGVYAPDNFDVAGSIVGVVEFDEIIDGKQIKPGDCLIGVASNGLHTNGYSLVRKVFFEKSDYSVTTPLEETQSTLGEELLRVHLSYHRLIGKIKSSEGLHGIAHITGGGIVDNTSRLLREGLDLQIDWSAWEIQPIFKIIQKEGNISDSEMRDVFNLGVGLVLIVDTNTAESFLGACRNLDEQAFVIGSIINK